LPERSACGRAKKPLEEIGVGALDLPEGPAAVAPEVDHAALWRPDRHPGIANRHIRLCLARSIDMASVAPAREERVVFGTLLGIAEHRIRLIDLRHPTRRVFARVDIRVVPLGQLAVDRRDDLEVGGLGKHQHLVVRAPWISGAHLVSTVDETHHTR
jgi:hypothetical protein